MGGVEGAIRGRIRSRSSNTVPSGDISGFTIRHEDLSLVIIPIVVLSKPGARPTYAEPRVSILSLLVPYRNTRSIYGH